MSTWQKLGTICVCVFVCVCVCDCDCVCVCFCHMSNLSHVTCHMWNAYVNPWNMLNNKWQVASVKCQMLILILGRCWTTFVFMSMLKSKYLQLCHMSHVTCHIVHVTCHMWNTYFDPFDMLNNFCFHVYGQMSLFMGENDNALFFTTPPYPVSGPIIELVPS